MVAPSSFNEADPEQLDADISSIRAEIRNLQRRKRFVISSLLASAPLQSELKAATTNIAASTTAPTKGEEDVSPLVQAAGNHAKLNHHRVAFSITTFPFENPAPPTPGSRIANRRKLLGVRIDICTRNGRFTQPYYLLLKKDALGGDGEGTSQAQDQNHTLRVYRHTIPSFISMEKLERAYLPRPRPSSKVNEAEVTEEDIQPPKPAKRRKQSLPALVRHVRKELVAWHLRRDAVDYLRESLSLARDDNEGSQSPARQPVSAEGKNSYGIVSLAAVSLETRHVRIEWDDGRVGRMKISDRGRVERAVVIGDRGRDKIAENVLMGGDGRVETVLERLKDAL